VVKFIELIQTQNNVYLIYEYCNGGTLEQLIQSQGRLKEQEAVELMRQIIKGMQSVVELNIVHRDLKPQNILFHNQVVKIIDFGFCKPLYNQNLAKTMLGSPIYMVPFYDFRLQKFLRDRSTVEKLIFGVWESYSLKCSMGSVLTMHKILPV
jgi:serine/threonine protein kinase